MSSFSNLDFSRGVNWVPATFITLYQSILLLALPFYFYYTPPSLGLILMTVLLISMTELSITAGYHRLYSHRAYKANRFLESVILFFSSMAMQGSALRWSYDHRIHHAFVDTDNDPYSINKGFLYAHCLWILEKPRKIEDKVVSDLLSNPLVRLQHQWSVRLMILTNVLCFLAVGYFFSDYLGAFVMAVWFRLFVCHHFTWFINSLAHTFGSKPFSQEMTAVNNWLISLVTFGEGYHNFHHTFANDYRNGIRWYHFDPTKWLIFVLNKMGLAKDLKKMDPFAIQKKMITEGKCHLLTRLQELWYVKKEEIEQEIQEVSDGIIAKINAMQDLKKRYLEAKSQDDQRTLARDLKRQFKHLRKELRAEWRRWKSLSSSIQKLKPLPI
ncbi:acyl-CoA desaturase [Estrella lausannensis]|uniref:Fatty-acid desaturase n=1 Tax=Estrella lausannensis TaxID=483423 RepID=A0A0H5DR19_9BACT|nr:fatty acid desaturase [Estrella lausannensis]CRX39116.1 Fatty-acid desaturase [Estrella lausannensis]